MTAIARNPRGAGSVHAIDVRCSAALPRGDRHEARCQLFAGHDGPHAIMYAQCGTRLVRTWRSSDRVSKVIDCRSAQNRPWMYGYPAPAWFEDEPALSD